MHFIIITKTTTTTTSIPNSTSISSLSSHSPSSIAMDPQDYPGGKSPRRELQGPRPTPLKVRKDSHKIRKPPVAPQQQPLQPAQPRPPVIIYTVSPKVIHANPSEFMTLVQRLTGPNSSSCLSTYQMAPSASSSSSFQDNSSAISPAARFASIEKTKSPKGKIPTISNDMDMIGGIDISTEIERPGLFPGILSPNPASLKPIPRNFFSPPSDPNPLNFYHDLSPINKNYLESTFMPSPSSCFFSPHMTSPTPSLDLFNNFSGF